MTLVQWLKFVQNYFNFLCMRQYFICEAVFHEKSICHFSSVLFIVLASIFCSVQIYFFF